MHDDDKKRMFLMLVIIISSVNQDGMLCYFFRYTRLFYKKLPV